MSAFWSSLGWFVLGGAVGALLGFIFTRRKFETEGKSAGQREDDPGNVHEHGTQTFRGTDQTGDAVHEQCKVTAEMPFSFCVI